MTAREATLGVPAAGLQMDDTSPCLSTGVCGGVQ